MPERDRTDHLVTLVRRHLGHDAVLGVYAHGSATLGGLRPHSDLDLLVVVRNPTTHARRAALTEELLTVSQGAGRRPVELIVVVHGDVRPWRYPPRRDYLYGEWLRAAYERGHVPGPEDDPDLAPLLTMVLRADTPLHGPPPSSTPSRTRTCGGRSSPGCRS